ncbi:MAG: hypothetical protein KKA62_01990 [Nanoarchaeota archaeon]|nr:hypothetical protein [Nanoarchaeota archaeon]MBU1643689.1 hypothetical protein [Nanoarchaeota archaeon]MBU1976705.1 hypothetical protein [Nanoarchaeota archaeon]
MKHKTLIELIRNPLVKEQIKPGIFYSLPVKKQIDYLIGVAEEAKEIAETAARLCPFNVEFQKQYLALETDFEKLQEEYPLHFIEQRTISKAKNTFK